MARYSVVFRIRLLRSIVIVLASFSFLFGAVGALHGEPGAARKILILSSYHRGLEWSDGVIDGVESVFQHDPDVELYLEYMDTKRHPSEEHLEQLDQIYAEKYRRTHFDVIISSDDNALDFLLARRDRLFPNVPIVFSGVNDFQDERIAGHRDITGINEAADFAGTLEIALRLHPDTERVVVVNDRTTTGKAVLTRLDRAIPAFSSRVDFEFLDGTISEVRAGLRSLPEHSIVLLLSFFRDTEGAAFSTKEIARIVGESSERPVYTCWGSVVRSGILGGKVISGLAHGGAAANMAQRILSGEPAEAVPVVYESPTTYMFDFRAMQRFGLDVSDLPAGSVILNRAVPFYTRHWRWIWGAVALILLETLMILRLLASRRMRKRAQESLRSHLELLRTLINAIPSPFFCTDKDGIFRACNKAFAEQIVGLPVERIVGRSPKDMPDAIPCDEVRKHIEHDQELLREPGYRTYEERVSCADGSQREFYINKATFSDGAGHPAGVVGVLVDLSERKKAEAALRESEKRFRDISENALEWIWEIDPDGRYTFASPVVEKLLGYKPEEIIGKHYSDLFHPDDRERVKRLAAEALIRRESFRSFLNRNIHRDGRSVWLLTSGVPIFDERGDLVGYRGADYDITERIQADEERRKLESQVQQAQKLESLGVLAGGIAHDFNNLLMVILGNADLASSSLSPVAPARENIDAIEKASRRAADLCRQMLAYSGKGQFVVRPVNISEIVEEMAYLLDVSISKKITLNYDFADDLPAVEADSAQIQQVIMNLITNASEAIGKRSGEISVKVSAMWCDRAHLADVYLNEDLPEGTYVCLEVSDTGAGMDKETVKKVFDPFFTTKFTGRGLGLAAVLGIVRAHRGAIKVDSLPGQGTTFRILLPAADGAALEAKKRVGEPRRRAVDGTVLIVDDEEAVLATGKEMLEQIGFRVLTAKDGREAKQVFREHADEIRCVVLDLTMPHMDGEETFRELKRIRADARVVLSSGYGEQEVANRFSVVGLAGFIQKPYQSDELLAEISRVLDQP